MHKLSCEQVSVLLSFYTEGKLSPKLAQSVKEHLQNCPECMEKFEKLQNIINEYKPIIPQPSYQTKLYKNFKTNLSAYIDNELDDDENIKIKKITISNPLARQDLEEIYNYKKLLHTSFEKTKNDSKNDYSKNIMNKIQHEYASENEPFLKLTAIFFAMITCILIGLIGLLYF